MNDVVNKLSLLSKQNVHSSVLGLQGNARRSIHDRSILISTLFTCCCQMIAAVAKMMITIIVKK